jgi:transglutaminase-like putative cysteine protease
MFLPWMRPDLGQNGIRNWPTSMSESSRKYAITHRTHYEYSSPSSLCHNQMHLRPRDLPYQRVQQSNVAISPTPDSRFQWQDSFGNRAEFFSIEQLHPHLTVTSKSIVERRVPDYSLERSPTWGEVASTVQAPRTDRDRHAIEFLHDSRHCQRSSTFLEYAAEIANDHRTFVDCVQMLNAKIYHEMRYSPDATQVSTKPVEALAKKKGVCQDFAQIAICCLRSLGIPARYVSGYLLTQPAPGKEKLIGADASHAWLSAYAGDLGWIDFDPTNNVLPGIEHITVAWGRDYADVAPIHGVFIGGGYTQLSVSVDVQPIHGAEIGTDQG